MAITRTVTLDSVAFPVVLVAVIAFGCEGSNRNHETIGAGDSGENEGVAADTVDKAVVFCDADTDCEPPYRCLTGVCGDCVSDHHCAPGLQCKKWSCSSTDCNTTQDCPGPKVCAEGTCVRCVGDWHCRPPYECIGTGLEAQCMIPPNCALNTGETLLCWECTEDICADEMHLQRCTEEGRLGQVVSCRGGGNGACREGACVTLACVPGEVYCEGNALYECSAEGDRGPLVERCEEGMTCARGECRRIVCEPGTRTCMMNNVAWCSDTGTGYKLEGMERCPDHHWCEDARCVLLPYAQ